MSKLQFKFDPNQNYQLAAIDSTVRLFEGLPPQSREFTLGDEAVSNMPGAEVLLDSWLLERLRAVRESNGFTEDLMHLEKEDGFELDGVSNNSPEPFPYFTVEMETGTGKTYVYLRTVYELSKRYGFSKFIIIVPSIAIYEGVKKTEANTRSHFESLYDNEHVALIPYDGSRQSRVRNFATSTQSNILIMTIDAFNRSTNNLYKPSEQLPGERLPYQYIQQTRPIIILDEPQSIDVTERARSAIRTLHPLFGLRYSATHRRSPNLIYRLTPVEAYRQNLVKKIQVIGLTSSDNVNEKFLALESVTLGPPITAELRTFVQQGGVARESEVTLKHGDDLYDKTKREEHRDGYIVEEINAAEGSIHFTNGIRVTIGDALAPSRPQVFQAQITETVRQHMETQQLLHPLGIKVLSLFFIDRVANYTSERGLIRMLFDKAFNNAKAHYPAFSGYRAEDVREGYFAKVKLKKDGDEIAVDTEGRTSAERDAERRAFELIMRNKEDLLSFEQPVCFIFAHSALKEGWDNPNVFQICTLNQTVCEIKKRQEIGRGLRLAVNQNGERVTQDDVNILTVIANQKYETYAANLQREYLEDGDDAPPPPKKPHESRAYHRNAIYNGQDFVDFWKELNRKTSYRIHVETEVLVKEVADRLKRVEFPETVVVLTRGRFIITEFVIRLDKAKRGAATITLEIKDTDGRTDTTQLSVIARADLARIKNDERIRGFKVQEIVGEGDDAVVKFTNGEELTRFQAISFRTEKGQRSSDPPTEVLTINNRYPAFNFIARAARETLLTRATLNQIFRHLPDEIKSHSLRNPEGFAGVFIAAIREVVADHIAARIEFILDDSGTAHDVATLFPEVKMFPQKELTDSGQRGLYDKVQLDSDVELRFIENVLRCQEDRVICYFKFPPLFKIELPKIIGNYNPDWGIVCYDDGKLRLHIVRETKGAAKISALQFPSEGRKITCAARHFKTLGISYRHITDKQLRWWADEGSPDPGNMFD